MTKLESNNLANHVTNYMINKYNFNQEAEGHSYWKERVTTDLAEAFREYDIPNQYPILEHLPDWVKTEILLSFIGKTLIMFDHYKAEYNAWCYGTAPEGYYDLYAKVIDARTEPFGKKEDSVVYILTLSWEDKTEEYMCGTFEQLLNLKIKE